MDLSSAHCRSTLYILTLSLYWITREDSVSSTPKGEALGVEPTFVTYLTLTPIGQKGNGLRSVQGRWLLSPSRLHSSPTSRAPAFPGLSKRLSVFVTASCYGCRSELSRSSQCVSPHLSPVISRSYLLTLSSKKYPFREACQDFKKYRYQKSKRENKVGPPLKRNRTVNSYLADKKYLFPEAYRSKTKGHQKMIRGFFIQ
jgi:hypothetical protein